jgi:methylmalonyl-CoA mutase C-terminal domain/subunit
MEELKARGLDEVLVFGGGVIPTADVATLKELGVAEVFTPGAPTQEIVDFLRSTVAVD